LTRPRSDLFMQHFLASRQMIDIPIKHLFVEYRFWIEREKPFKNVTAELATLAKQRDDFRRLLEPGKGDVVYGLAKFLNDFDISTPYPLLLYLFDAGLSGADWEAVSISLESYLVRRAVLGWTTKSYNKIFFNLTKAMRQAGPTPQALRVHLSRLQGDTAAWPTDEVFAEAWRTRPAYELLNNAKLVHILRRVGETFLTSRNERLTIDGPLSIEHILPQAWIEHWPLASGESGLTDEELLDADADDPRAVATRDRNNVLQTMGNLTILTQALNSSVSNSAWPTKKPEILIALLLPINQKLHEYEVWGEAAIQKRREELLKHALGVWPAPLLAERQLEWWSIRPPFITLSLCARIARVWGAHGADQASDFSSPSKALNRSAHTVAAVFRWAGLPVLRRARMSRASASVCRHQIRRVREVCLGERE